MQSQRTLIYLMFACMFVLVIIGIITHSYILLSILMVSGMIIGIFGDFIENRPTNQYRSYNKMHNRHSRNTHA